MPLTEILRGCMYGAANQQKAETKPKITLDSAAGDENATFDSASSFELAAIAQNAVAALHQWAETDDLESGETMADRLMAMFVGIADNNKDGELDEDEQELVQAALEAAWDYLDSIGVGEDDISLLLNDWDDAVANNVIDLIATSLPDGDAADDIINDFAFGNDAQDAVFDATYAKRIAIRGGKKVRINKRISGTVRLSAKQKMAIRKMQSKSHSAKSRARRLRSMKLSRQMA